MGWDENRTGGNPNGWVGRNGMGTGQGAAGNRQPIRVGTRMSHTGGYKDESYGWVAHDGPSDRLSLTLISFVRKGGKRGWALLIFSIVFLRLCATKGGEPVT